MEYLSFNAIIVSSIPTFGYFLACLFYSQFQLKGKNDNVHVTNSSRNAITTAFGNMFFVCPLITYYTKSNIIRLPYVCLGIFIIDTIEYFLHYTYHLNLYIYHNIHNFHHKPHPINPYIALCNNDYELVITTPLILICFLIFKITYIEYIIITTLAIIATVCDHTYTSNRKFHILHHNNNKNTNFQQPFLTYWDYICGTYNKHSKIKIPFVP